MLFCCLTWTCRRTQGRTGKWCPPLACLSRLLRMPGDGEQSRPGPTAPAVVLWSWREAIHFIAGELQATLVIVADGDLGRTLQGSLPRFGGESYDMLKKYI